MTEQRMKQREAISAMADGQLSGAELAQTLDSLRSDDAAVATWHCYHLIGEVMRSGASWDASRDTVFLQRLRANLEHEVLAAQVGEPNASISNRPSANDARFRWRWVAGLAVMAVAVTVGWMSVSGIRQPNSAPALAQRTVSPPSASDTALEGRSEAPIRPQAMIRDPKLDQWLAAHRQFGGASALQVPAGFVRNATFEGAAR